MVSNQSVITVVVLGDQDGQFVFFDRHERTLFRLVLRPERGRRIRDREPERRTFALFGLHADPSAHVPDDRMADRKAETGALFEVVQLDEPSENAVFLILRNSASPVSVT